MRRRTLIPILLISLAACGSPADGPGAPGEPGGDNGMNLTEAKQQLQTIIDDTASEVLDGLKQDAREGEGTCADDLGRETGEWVGDYAVEFEFKDEKQGRAIVDETLSYWEGRGIEVRPAMIDGGAPRLYVEDDKDGLTYSLLVVMDTKRGEIAGNTGCRQR